MNGLPVGEKILRLRAHRKWSQERLAQESGLGASSIAHIETGNRNQLRPKTITQLADAFQVPAIYFLTEDPREYARVRVASLPAGIRLNTTAERIRWLLEDLAVMWGPEEFGYAAVAAKIGVQESFLRAIVAGQKEVTPQLVDEISRLSGVPTVWFITGHPEGVAGLREEYRAVAMLAQELQVDATILRTQVELLAKAQGRSV